MVRLEFKIARCQFVTGMHQCPDVVLFVFPSAGREREVQRSLSFPGFTLATAVRADVLRYPLGPVWLPLRDGRRYAVLDLPLEPRAKPG